MLNKPRDKYIIGDSGDDGLFAVVSPSRDMTVIRKEGMFAVKDVTIPFWVDDPVRVLEVALVCMAIAQGSQLPIT